MDAVKVYTKSEFTREPGWDSSFKFLFMLKGNLSIFVGTKERHLHVHDFTFVKPFELHGGSSGQDQCKALIVELSTDLWKNVCPNADSLSFRISILHSNYHHPAYAAICRSLAQIIHYSRTASESSPSRICQAASEIIAVLTENFISTDPSHKYNEQNLTRILDILKYIVNNYTRKLTLEEISGAIGFHPQYFSAYFKKHFGVSFIDYLNNYRISKSLTMLKDTQESILSIALACGFNSHKTYSNAFEKQFQCTPREYRRVLRSQQNTPDAGIDADEFEYLRNYWNRNDPFKALSSSERIKCSIIPDTRSKTVENKSHHFVSIGRAISCLRSDMQKQLIKARQDLDIDYVRFRDIFSDDLFVYYEDRNKNPVFSWRALDEIFDFLISADLKPFIEIGYMPEQMSSRKQYAGWQYHPNVSSPKSMKLWELLVSSFINHLISRYGKDAVESWLFDFWTSPNLRLQHGYWNESMETFFQFYRTTYSTVKKIDSNIRLGSPNFSYPTGFGYYDRFFEFASKHNIRPDFLSTHLYSCGDGEDKPAERFIEYYVFDNNYNIPNIKPERKTIPRAIDELCHKIENSPFKGLPIIIDDWNVTFFPTDFTRDTSFMGPFVVESYFQACRKVYGMGFASLSDIHEDFFNTDQMFNGGPGLLTYTGIPKSAYYAMGMAYKFSRHILEQGSNYIVGTTDSGYEVLVYNMDFYNEDYVGNDPSVISFTNRYNVFESVPDMDCHIELPAQNGAYSVVKSYISQTKGSSYDAWVRMGSPSDITPEISQYLTRISTPEMNYETINSTGSIILDEVLEPHSVMHIRISKV